MAASSGNVISGQVAMITGGEVAQVGRVRLRPQVVGASAAMPAVPPVTMHTAAQLRGQTSSQRWGGVSGTVLGPHGRHIKGLCLEVDYPGAISGYPIGADGRYNTGKYLTPGKVAVGFTTACDLPFGTASSNWAPEWYRDKFRQVAANTVVIKAGKITRGIDGVMRPGGVIAGTVTGSNGRGLAGVCVVAATPKGDVVQQVTTPSSGRYKFQGLDPGQYGIGFYPNCGQGSLYLPQWWPGTPIETKRGLIRTGFGTQRTHVDARMMLGGTISGTVKLRNRQGPPIKGICVFASSVSQPSFISYLGATNAKGQYAIRGLAPGIYSLSFGPGCNNNGNYLFQNYPHNVRVRLARVTGNINAYLQPGAIITGTVTAKSGGAKLAGICETTADGYGFGMTGADGTYTMDQLPPGKTHVEFYNCRNRGNFAPQFYPDQLNAAAAASITDRPGQVTSGIDAALAPGATISGTIALPSGRPLSGVCVDAIPTEFAGDVGGNGAQSLHGRYVIQDLAPGDYQVGYTSCGGPSIADVWFKAPGSVTGDPVNADQIYVPAAGSVPDIDAVLQIGGYISGWVYGPASQQQSFVCIAISDFRTGVPAANGFFPIMVGEGYTIFGFAPGRYLIEFQPCGGQNLAIQWYDRASRPAKARPVLVRAGHTSFNVDAWLTTGGSITGRVVSKASGKPLRGACIFANGISQPFFGLGRTNRSGIYTVKGLNTGTYRLYFSSCGTPNLVPVVTGAVRATVRMTVTAPTVAMVRYQGGAISGRAVAAGSPPEPAVGSCVWAFPTSPGAVGQQGNGATTGASGYYQISDLIPGKYKVLFNPGCDPGGLVPQWYKAASRKSMATVVSVSAGQTTRSISVTLPRYGSITGTVTGPQPARTPLAGICVQALPLGAGGTPYLVESAGPQGSYSFGPLPPGKYLVEFESGCGASGYATQWWDGAAKMGAATTLVVRPGRTRSAINATMTQGS